MSWYSETFNKYNSLYVSDNYYLKLLGNTITIMTKPKRFRKPKAVFNICMALDSFNEYVMEFILDSFGFYKCKEVEEKWLEKN